MQAIKAPLHAKSSKVLQWVCNSALVVVAAGFLLLTSGPASAAAAALDPTAFVQSAATEAIGVLTSKTTPDAERKARFKSVILKSFDAPAVGRFVLGSYWGKANPDQQGRFQNVFKEALAQIYIERFFDYDGHSLQVVGTKPGAEGATIVQTTVGTPTGGAVYSVDWVVLSDGKRLSLLDVVIDGVSTITTTKQDYASVLRSANGNLDGLSSRLEEKMR